jgi:glycerol uptake facilitator-like aquaporin
MTKFVSPGQLFALEYLFCQALIFTAFGVGLDPRQGETISPAFAPVLIGAFLALANLASGLTKTGYTGMYEASGTG